MTLKERYAGVIGWFEANMPVAESELQYKDPSKKSSAGTSPHTADSRTAFGGFGRW